MSDELQRDQARLSAAEKRAQDFDDLQNELAGRDNTGRMQRFLGGDRDGAGIEKGRKKREQAQVSALEAMMLADPEYAALYNEVSGQLRQAEIATDKALFSAEQTLDALLENAARRADLSRVSGPARKD